MDCDGQHQPERIPVLLEAIHDCDIVSGSRYLRDFRQDTPAPTDRRFINATITREINARYGLNLTDAFCGFKAYRRDGAREAAHHRTRVGHAAATVGAGGAAGTAREGDRRPAAVPRPEPRVRRGDERPGAAAGVLPRRAGGGRARRAARGPRRRVCGCPGLC